MFRIPKESASKGRVCKCGVIVWRAPVWSEKLGRYEFQVFDCEGQGLFPPKSRIAGIGQPHQCKEVA